MIFTYSLPKIKQNESLKTSIQHLVAFMEATPNVSHAISILSQRFAIKRRRLYDIINVLMSIGCCQKSCLDQIIWLGKNQITEKIIQLKESKKLSDPNLTLSEMFPVNGCIGISNLTTSFILLFFALKTNRLDLRFISQYFSRQTTRYKTTLCKLYQICFILGAVSVTTRTTQVCEVLLNEPYYNDDIITNENELKSNEPLSIDFLLNRPRNDFSTNYISQRRKDFNDTFIESVSNNLSNKQIDDPFSDE